MAIRSNSNKAKKIIQSEIKAYYGADPKNRTYGKDYIRNMQQDANSSSKYGDDWSKGKRLVNEGNFACYYDDQRKMLNKIYGKKNVDRWSNNKIHNTYGNLIAREYSSLLRKKKTNK